MQEGEVKTQEQHEQQAKTGIESRAFSSWDVAKWLIPSVSALCIVLGYIAKFAHHAFLGFDPGLLEPGEYLAATGEFLRWVLHLPESGWLSWQHALFDTAHLIAVWPALALGVGIMVWRHRHRSREAIDERYCRWARHINTLALLAVLLLRLVALDAPVARLEGALAASIVWKPSGQKGQLTSERENITERLQQEINSSSALHRAIVLRAQTLWNAKRCVRPTAPQPRAPVEESCTAAHYAGVEDGEGLAQLLVTVMLLSLAIRILMERSEPWSAGLAWLAIFSCMLLPVTFGKLGHSLEYDFAEIGLKTSLTFDDSLSSGVTTTSLSGSPSAAPPAASDSASPVTVAASDPSPEAKALMRRAKHVLQGVVLQSDKVWTTVVVDEVLGCTSEVKIWRVANSEILWERDIFKTDVLSWSAAKTFTSSSACASAKPSLYGGASSVSSGAAPASPASR